MCFFNVSESYMEMYPSPYNYKKNTEPKLESSG